jgi:hypothetical protein
LNFATAIITASKVVMVGKVNDNIDAVSRIINELHALVFVAITMRGSVWRRALFAFVFAPVARTRANRKAPA